MKKISLSYYFKCNPKGITKVDCEARKLVALVKRNFTISCISFFMKMLKQIKEIEKISG